MICLKVAQNPAHWSSDQLIAAQPFCRPHRAVVDHLGLGKALGDTRCLPETPWVQILIAAYQPSGEPALCHRCHHQADWL